MKRKFLENLFKDLEVEDSVKNTLVQTILDENGNDINNEKAKTEGVKNDLKVKKALIDELNEKVKKAESTDIETIKKQEYERGKSEASKEMEEFKKTNALKSAIKGAKDFDLVFSKLNNDKIKYNKNEKGEYEIEGLEEQLKAVKKDYSYLFEEEKQDKESDIKLNGNHTQTSDDDDLADFEEAMGIVEDKK